MKYLFRRRLLEFTKQFVILLLLFFTFCPLITIPLANGMLLSRSFFSVSLFSFS